MGREVTTEDGTQTMTNSTGKAPKVAAWTIGLAAAAVSIVTGGFYPVMLFLLLVPVAAGLPVIYAVYRFAIRGKAGWQMNPFAWPDLLTPVATMLVWFLPECIAPVLSGKSLANAAFEPLILGGLLCVAWIVRLLRFSKTGCDKQKVAWIMLGGMCVLSLVVFALVPGLEE